MSRAIIGFLSFFFLSSVAYAQSAFVEQMERTWPKTDFTKSSIEFREVLDGGPGKDGIPAMTDPEMIQVSAEDKLEDLEPVMTVELEGQTPRAYPIRYLMWHEIINDSAGDNHFSVTFCPDLIFDSTLKKRSMKPTHDGHISVFV